MQFDKSFVAIRSRGTLELFDLGLHVIRDYWWQLSTLLVLGAAPWVIADATAMTWMMGRQPRDEITRAEGWLLLVLVASQAQIGTVFISHFLGQAIFAEQPRIMVTIKAVFSRSIGLIWLHLILRGGIFVLWVVASIEYDMSGDSWAGILVLMVCLLLGGFAMRILRPYVNEVLVLEQAPFSVKKNQASVTFGRRSSGLHGGSPGDLIGKGIVSGLIAGALALSLYGALNFVLDVTALSWNSLWWQDTIAWVTVLWITAGYIAVVRFLSYLDLRIRQEGWDVELLIRAEAFRMHSQI